MKNTAVKAKLIPEKENAFGAAVLNALKKRNVNDWIALYPTNEEYRGILQAGLAAKAEGLTQEIIDAMLVRRKTEAAAAYTTQFEHFCKRADSVGVLADEVTFQQFKFAVVYPEPVKLKYLDAVIYFNCGQKQFVMEGIQAVAIAAGYKLQAIGNIRQIEE